MSLGASPWGETIGVAVLHLTTWIVFGSWAPLLAHVWLLCLNYLHAYIEAVFCGSFKQVPLSRVAAKAAPGQAAASKLQAAPAGAPVSQTLAKLQPVERIAAAEQLCLQAGPICTRDLWDVRMRVMYFTWWS